MSKEKELLNTLYIVRDGLATLKVARLPIAKRIYALIELIEHVIKRAERKEGA